jgi:hypothetical protein
VLGVPVSIQDLGSIGEIVAAVATIATLIYLSIQLRSNTQATQSANRHEITRDYRSFQRLCLDPKVDSAWIDGMVNYPGTDENKNAIFRNLMVDQALMFQAVFAQFENNQLDIETYEAYLAFFAGLVSTPGGAAWWNDGVKSILVDKTVKAVDSRVKEGNLPTEQIALHAQTDA